jgi:hypothetical protein
MKSAEIRWMDCARLALVGQCGQLMDNIRGISLPEMVGMAKWPARGRSIATNGLHALRGVDSRTAAARRYRDLTMSLADDLGGPASLTEAQRALVRQAAAMIVQSEKLQGEVLRGEVVDSEQLVRLANAATRILSRLGIKRTPRDTTPTLAEIAARHRLPKAAAE